MKERVERLVAITPQQWGEYGFSRDPLHRRLTAEQRREMAARAQECGREQARLLKEKMGEGSPSDYARKLGMKIDYKDSCGTDNYVTFAQYRSPDQITLFMGNVKNAEQLISENQLEELLQNVDVAQLLIAHELYHNAEDRSFGLYTCTEKLTLWHIGRFQYRSALICLSELGAMAFAAELLGLRYSPYVFDVLLPWCSSEKQARSLYEQIIAIAGQQPAE